ncbi:MAG: FHA domain-containing protein [Anaerolineales bacterium]|jgi:pSer/pThr/pTyr-binding forkhead associated (FHA) protein
MNCKNCGSPVEPGKKFCGECGQPVVVDPPPTEAPPPLPDDIPTQLAYEPAPPEEVWVLSRPGLEPIIVGETTLLGRGTDCDYMLDDTQASRRHALIEKGEEGYTLIDQDSSNGTFVDEERIFGPVLLSEGDTIRIGQTVFTFEQLAETEAKAESEAAQPPAAQQAEPAPPAKSAVEATPQEEAVVEATPPVDDAVEATPPVEVASEPASPAESSAASVQAQAPAETFCPSCGAALEPGIAFCGECGHQLTAAPAAGQPQAAVPDWDPIEAMEPQPIDARRIHFSRKGLRIGCLVVVGVGLALTCFLYVLDYLVGLLL